MIRAIRVLAVAGLVAVALAAWMAYAHIFVAYSERDIAPYLQPFAYDTGNLLSFSAGLLTLTLTVPRRQRPWSAAMLASLILNGYWFPASYALPISYLAFNVISYGLVPTAPALLALVYTIRAARSAPQAPQAGEEQGSLDITIEPIGSKTR